MKFIEDLEPRVVGSGKNIRKRPFALFECEVCNERFERMKSQGLKAKSCSSCKGKLLSGPRNIKDGCDTKIHQAYARAVKWCKKNNVDIGFKDDKHFKQWARDNGYDDSKYLCRNNQTEPHSESNCYWGTRAQSINKQYKLTSEVYNAIKSEVESGSKLKDVLLKYGVAQTTYQRFKQFDIEPHNGTVTHNKSKTRIYNVWLGMKSRCSNPNNDFYHRYGGRGITICEEWKKSFDAFHDWSMNHGYDDNLSIERIDVNGNYEPSNCEWIPLSMNTRRAHLKLTPEIFLEMRKEVRSGSKVVDVAKKYGFGESTYRKARLKYEEGKLYKGKE